MVWVVSLCIVLTSCLVLFSFRSLVPASSITVPPRISSSCSSIHVFASLRVAAHWWFTFVCRCLETWGWISLQFESPSSHVLAASWGLWFFSRTISSVARSNWPWRATTCLLFSWSVSCTVYFSSLIFCSAFASFFAFCSDSFSFSCVFSFSLVRVYSWALRLLFSSSRLSFLSWRFSDFWCQAADIVRFLAYFLDLHKMWISLLLCFRTSHKIVCFCWHSVFD